MASTRSSPEDGRIIMHTDILRRGLGAVAFGFVFAVCAANAETINLKSDLKGTNEVPAIQVSGTGTATLTYDTASKTLTWTITYKDLTGAPRAGHFHGPAPAGKNAPVVIPFAGSLASPIKGSTTLTDDQAKDLLAGMYYINLHTAAHPPGEIRGQVTK
jgi:hypothetical protein